jgi:hypothetical protein
MPNYEFAAHHELMISEIEEAVETSNGRLYIGMPPRHGKSETGTIRTCAWHIGRFPEKQIMLLCHGQDLANEFRGAYERLCATTADIAKSSRM